MSKLRKPKNQSKSTNNRYFYLLLSGIIILTALIYNNSLNNNILNFDDNEYFSNYYEITHLSFQSIKTFFTSYYVIMYQPLPILTFAINYNISGLESFPLHVVNLIFHLLNIFLVFCFVFKLSGKYFIGFIAALLFALHPMNIESVSWISARSSGMYTFFYLGALVFYIDYLKTKQFKYIIFCAVLFILSLFSKAQAVTLPVIMLLLDVYLNRKDYKQILIEKTPFLLLSLIFGIITLSNKGTLGNITKGMLISYNFTDIIFMLSYSYSFYIFKLFLPVKLCSIYVYPPKIGGLLPIEYYLSPILILLIIFFIYKTFKNHKYVIFGILFFFITISINIQIIPSRLFIVADRYSYLPFLGLFYCIAQYFFDIYNSKNTRLKQIFIFLLAVNILCYIYIIINRNMVWKDNITLMTDIIQKNPKVPYISRAYGTRANTYQQENKLLQALEDFNKAIEIKNDDDLTYYNRALLNIKMQRYNEAIQDLDKSISIDSNVALKYCNRAVAKYFIKDYKSSMSDCNKTISLNKNILEVYNTRGAISYFFNNYKASEDDFTYAIKLNPENPESYNNRANLYFSLKQSDKACKDWSKAAELGNNNAYNMFQKNCVKN